MSRHSMLIVYVILIGATSLFFFSQLCVAQTPQPSNDDWPKYDNLEVFDVSYTPSRPIKKEPVTVEVAVRNEGEVYHENITLSFYSDDEIVGNSTILVLGPGVNGSTVFIWTPMESGPHRLKFVLDPEDNINETDEEDNVLINKVTVSSSSSESPQPPCGLRLFIGLIATGSFSLAGSRRIIRGRERKLF